MKVHFLFESEQESAEREAVMDCELYRGVSEPIDTPEMIKIPIRQDRRPRTSFLSCQIIFNAFFEMAFGDKDVRTRAMFCSNVRLDASAYTSLGSDRGGHVLSVYPLKTSKAAYIPNKRDSLDFIEGIGFQFIRALKALFSNDDNMDRIGAVSRQSHAITNGESTNCLEQVNAVISTIEGLCKTDDERNALKAAIQNGIEEIKQYKVIPASQLASASSTGEAEFMVYDAPYFYGIINTNNFDEDGIPY